MSQPSVCEELPAPEEDAYERIAALVHRHTGIKLTPGKAYFVMARLGGLYRSFGCDDWDELADRLERAEGTLLDRVIQAVVTPETQFYRDLLPFGALREKIAPELAPGRSRAAPLTVWSAGCSTGQEPYSILMSLWNCVERGELEVQVWATDICDAFLEQGRRGEYGPLELRRGLDQDSRVRFFEDTGGGRARVRSELRRRVRFERLNLLAERPPPGATFSVVFCRNVAIYFDRKGKREVYRKLADAVTPGGYLVLGASETLFPGMPDFETIYFNRSLLFRRKLG
jgi:chemotaxis protein methyltransferase CheR